MRARGTKVTDVAVLVVAADDGCRPQTLEAISHARAAKVPIVVAINKIDKEGASSDRVKQELSEKDLIAEDWGGDTVMVPVSAIKKQNIDKLLEMILLVSEVEDLQANPDRFAKGTVISVGEGENLIEKIIKGESTEEERCYIAGQKPRNKLIHEQPSGTVKTACNYKYIKSIWPEFDWYLEGGDYYVGVQTKRGCPHNCCFCVYTVVEGKQVRVNPVKEVIKEMKQLYDLGVRGFWFTDAQFIPAKKHIEDAKILLQAIKDQGWEDINWAAYIRADNIDAELAQLMVDTGMSYFEIGITSGSQELVRKMRLAYDLETVLNNCKMLVQSGFKNHVSVNYSFNVFDETPNTIRQTIAYHRELENIFGKGLVDPAIFFIGLQPHTLLEKYALDNKILKPNYNPMSMMPWTARKLLWNPGSLGKKLGQVCLEAFDNPEDEFGKTVIDILEREYGKSSLKESLKVRPLSERKLAHSK